MKRIKTINMPLAYNAMRTIALVTRVGQAVAELALGDNQFFKKMNDYFE